MPELEKPANTDPNNPSGEPGEAPAPAPAAPVAPAASEDQAKPNNEAKYQSQRDKAQRDLDTLHQAVEPIVVERALDSFLADNKADFPDLTRDDLMMVANSLDPADLKEVATALQNRFQEHAQKKVLEIQNPQPPSLTAKERDAELQELRDKPQKNGFQRMIQLARRPVSS